MKIFLYIYIYRVKIFIEFSLNLHEMTFVRMMNRKCKCNYTYARICGIRRDDDQYNSYDYVTVIS